jgi:hypothetical protein
MNRSMLLPALLAALAVAACDRATAVDVAAPVALPGDTGEGIRAGATPPAASAPADSIYSITSPRSSP